MVFFKNSFAISKNTEIKHLPAKETVFLEDTKTLIYNGFKENFKGMKFNFISVDGPGHSRSKLYRRVDLLYILPDCLDEKFCILFDDINDPPCKMALLLIEKKLDECEISYCKGMYSGKKEVALLCDKDSHFLCSL